MNSVWYVPNHRFALAGHPDARRVVVTGVGLISATACHSFRTDEDMLGCIRHAFVGGRMHIARLNVVRL